MQKRRLTLSEALTLLVDIFFIQVYSWVGIGGGLEVYDFVFPIIWCGMLIFQAQDRLTPSSGSESESEESGFAKLLWVCKELILVFADICFLNQVICGYYCFNIFEGYPAVWISLFLIAAGLRVLLSIVWLYRGIDGVPKKKS